MEIGEPDPSIRRRTIDGGKSIFFGTMSGFEEFQALVAAYTEFTKGSLNIRLIVLETWLLIDYSLKSLLMSGLNLEAHDHQELDLRYKLLPRGLKECIELLRSIRDVETELRPEPEPAWVGLGRKWEFLEEYSPGLGKLIEGAEAAYARKYGIERDQSNLVRYYRRYRSVPDGWLEVAARVDETWVKGAMKLINARNVAAHRHDAEAILKTFGANGANAVQHAKEECMSLAQRLIGLKPLDLI